ncbi:substrate-binding and vWA domain-containing protein [Streptomyces sp. S465]|uniref:substrate-binding and vWA domain-containing protein n=1 Tax=Streptomyces sp. S465 TaxID=2979468 RepID=UPI0022A83E61|nr:VWA domain-containing protein [Streptomyces sp. S465]WAP59586.1 VWA domain-containing protein [Streptomyces sp. S465]
MRRRPHRRVVLALCLALLGTATATACGSGDDKPTTLRVLASSELRDMAPLLDDLRRDTGVELDMEYRATVDAGDGLTPGAYHHDLAWLASDRYFQLRLKESHGAADKPLATTTMLSPVVVGVKPDTARALRARAKGGQVSWADIADAAAAGSVRFGMADPERTNSGLSALVGVATAAAGTGSALRAEDISCDRLRGFRTGQKVTAESSAELREEFIAHQDELDALITYESELLSLNAGGRLHEKLEIIYPKDGMVLSDYPLLLLDPAKRDAYDKVVAWLKSASTQQKIMERTLRRPLGPQVRRDPRLRADIGNALYFPDQRAVVDQLVEDYGDPRSPTPNHVIFLLDFSTSMRGARVAALRSAFAGLSGADTSATGKFVRFYQGERITVMRFGGRVLAERDVTVGGRRDLRSVDSFVAADDFDDSTAIWSALDHAYRKASGIVRDHPGQPVSIVLMTDGENTSGITFEEFRRRYAARAETVRSIPTFPLRLGAADTAELTRAARTTGGRVVDAGARSLPDAFKEIRGC